MKKNSPGCTCCKPYIFTQSNARLTQLVDDYYYRFNASTGLPGWAANINATIDGDSEAAKWWGSSPLSGLIPTADYLEPDSVCAAGIVHTPGGWVYFIGRRQGIDLVPVDRYQQLNRTRFAYIMLGFDIAAGKYTAEVSGDFPPVITKDEFSGHTPKITPRTPGRDARSLDDIFTVIGHDDVVQGPLRSTTQEQVWLNPSDEIPWFLRVGNEQPWPYTYYQNYWNPDYVAWQRETVQAIEYANGFEVYEKNSRVKKYSVPGASISKISGSFGVTQATSHVGFKEEFAPTGSDVYWLAHAAKELWRFRNENYYYRSQLLQFIPDVDYGPLQVDSAFPFVELVKDESIIDAASFPNFQRFDFLIKNDEPLAMCPTAEGSVDYIEGNLDWTVPVSQWTPGHTSPPFVITKQETKNVTVVLGNLHIAYSHAIGCPIIVGTFKDDLVFSRGISAPSARDSVTLADSELAQKTVVYKYDGEWVEIARFDSGFPSAICEGIDGAMYVLGPQTYRNLSWVLRIDAKTGSTERMEDGYFESGGWGRNWMALPTSPELGYTGGSEKNPPPTVAG